MIIGIGTDIIEIKRIAASLERQGDAFWERILAPEERREIKSAKRRLEYLAGRFAAKEAASKALGTGIGEVGLHDLVIWNNERGAPQMYLQGGAAKVAEQLGVRKIHVSISHSEHYATATVVAEG
ncbi:holo-ACP synthase [Tumebacillus sp. DT12]|uniref:Holo-[acyl-carrier-protein] synthase n=1 Tax=Tumebacillus lacus TaxID=2995335 RepID=A0ABT3X5Q8_9BACL|nr:holo-ACP synthase [Tumebacillus lacus]MCX7572229.1 holo-ACP synthase [Tumebacillus lacus]